VTRLVCPFCGPRALEEFVFRKTLPEPGSDEFAAVYTRASDIGHSAEYWQHQKGCRAWLRVIRNPSTGEVHEVVLLGGARL